MKLAIFGSGGHGRVVADAAEASGLWHEIVFYDAKWPDLQRSGAWPVVGSQQDLLRDAHVFDGVIVAIGNNQIRLQIQYALANAGAKIATVIHPAATLSRHTIVGVGTVIFAKAVVNIGASLGQACIINTGATIDHDCTLDDGVHVSPGANLAGATHVGRASWIGIGACTRQLINIGSDVVIGAGGVVVKDIPDNMIVAGNPVRQLFLQAANTPTT
ncbi:acetyltransferase [Bordetella sp. J329]|nr:acetyltransferase [Bordetella sp. J329]